MKLVRALALTAAVCVTAQSGPAAKPSPTKRAPRKRVSKMEASGARAFVYKTVGDRELKLYVLSPEGHAPADKRPAIVFYHGGGWVGGAPGQFAEHGKYLAKRGMVTVHVQYRLL